MRRIHTLLPALLLATPMLTAAAQAADGSRAVAGGGISVPGWAGAVDASEAKAGMTLTNAKFAAEGRGFRITTGPSTTYWNTATTLKGTYTVRATFTEPKFQSLNDHPHPYGVVVAASGLDGAAGQALYCAAYGTGTYIVRGFGPAPFQVSARRPTAHPAIKRAGGPGESVSQEIAISVTDSRVSCSINGTEVASFAKADVLGDGKLKTTDGFGGVRVGHNAEVIVTGYSAGR
ncbi:MAG: hypothetical protein SFW08_08895 [Gemmatimonadaceae bacterium]|nr:hypothetical protein [Gemmatimonadaceae bacterium]